MSAWRSQPVYATSSSAGTISTYAGGGLGNGQSATTVQQVPSGLTLASSALYIADGRGAVRAVDLGTGIETVIAGNGTSGTSGDGGPATKAQLNQPNGLALDGAGNLYIATLDRIREVSSSGIISTVAGGGSGGDGGPATSAFLNGAEGVFVDRSGNVFIAEAAANRIREVDHTTGVIQTVAGNGSPGFSGDGGSATSAELNHPEAVVVDGSGHLFIADTKSGRIREVVSGVINTVAGGGSSSSSRCQAASQSATAANLYHPSGIHFDASGNLFITDNFYSCVDELSGSLIKAVTGNGIASNLWLPTDAVPDGAGNLFVSDTGNVRVLKVSGSSATLYAGTGQPIKCTTGDGFQATDGTLCSVGQVTMDGGGNLYIADPAGNEVRRVTAGGVISTLAGTGTPGYSGDGGSATSAELYGPTGIAVDTSGNLFIAEQQNCIIREVSKGMISTFAGTPGGCGFSGDGGDPRLARLWRPEALAFDSSGNLFVSDSGNNRIRKISSRKITTVAGGGTSPADGIPATTASISTPTGIAVDSTGDLYIGDSGNRLLRKVDPAGSITTVAKTYPYGVNSIATAPGGHVVFTVANEVKLVSRLGLLTIVGSETAGFSGDGGRGTSALLNIATGLVFDSSGNLYIGDGGDTQNARVRRVEAYIQPAPPTAVTAAAATNAASVHWTPPVDDGGLPVASYDLTPMANSTPGATVTVTPAATSTFVPISAGKPYTFSVTASNGWDRSGPSAASSAVVSAGLTGPGGIVTYAGSAGTGPAKSIGQLPYSLAVNGPHVYVGDFANPVVRDVDLGTGQETVLAGDDGYGYVGDGGPAVTAMIQGAGALAHCGTDTYVADTFNYAIRKIDSAGTITTLVGTGTDGYSGDGGPGKVAQISRVFGLACRTGGGLYISDADNGAVRILDQNGTINTWWYGFSFPLAIIDLGSPDAAAVIDGGGDRVVWNLTDLNACVVAGRGFSSDCAAGPSTQWDLYDPRGLATSGGLFFIADRGHNEVLQVDPTSGDVSIFAGQTYVPGFSGDGGPVANAKINGPAGLVVANNTLYMADSANYRVRAINLSSLIITTIAGNGTPSFSGDGAQATVAQLGSPYDVVFDQFGDEFVSDNQNSAVRKITPDGVITTIAGNGSPGYTGDGHPSTESQLNHPEGIAVDDAGNLYIADSFNGSVRYIDHATGLITTIVSSGSIYPTGLAVDASRNVYISDASHNRVWRYTPGPPGSYAPFAGTGAAGYSGDGGAAASAQLNNPSGLAVDSLGNLYIADMGNSRVRKVDHANGQITTVAGNGMFGLAGDGGPAYLSELANPFDVTVDSAGDIYIADTFNQRIREINTRGVITSVVGICGVVGAFSGDNGPASIGHINYPVSVGVDPVGDLSVADIANNRVRTVQEPIPARGAVCPSPAGTPGARGVSPTNPASPLARIVNHQTSKRPLVPDQALHSGPAHVTKPIRSQTAPRRPTQTHLNPAGSSTSQGHPLARGGGTGSWPAAAQTARSSGGVMLLTSGVLVLVLVSGGVVGLRRKRRREGSAGPPS